MVNIAMFGIIKALSILQIACFSTNEGYDWHYKMIFWYYYQRLWLVLQNTMAGIIKSYYNNGYNDMLCQS